MKLAGEDEVKSASVAATTREIERFKIFQYISCGEALYLLPFEVIELTNEARQVGVQLCHQQSMAIIILVYFCTIHYTKKHILIDI